jgi:hypothetical protein
MFSNKFDVIIVYVFKVGIIIFLNVVIFFQSCVDNH